MSVLLRGIKEVFTKPRYVALAVIVAVGAFLFATWLPNLGVVVQMMPQSIPFAIKLQLLVGLTESIGTNFSALSAASTIASAILLGIDIALIAYYMKERAFAWRQGAVAASVGGMVSGVFGIGCAACGSFVLMNIFAAIGLSGGIALLPLHGGEFGILSVALLGTSLVLVAKRIGSPQVCDPVEHRNEK